MLEPYLQKNIVYGDIIAGGNVHIGDKIYLVDQAFEESVLFLSLEQNGDQVNATLSVKSRQIGDNGAALCEHIPLSVPPELFHSAESFHRSRVQSGMLIRTDKSTGFANPELEENELSQWMIRTFFQGPIGEKVLNFTRLLVDRKIKDLHLIVTSPEETLLNLPWEMCIPHFFPLQPGAPKEHLAVKNFCLARSTQPSLGVFSLKAPQAAASPLKLLFVTALPENLEEQGKMLQLEEEQRRLIDAVGGLEATGDDRPKMVVEFLDCASLEEMDKALDKNNHDIVHISGHGAFREGRGVLFLEDEKGDVRSVDGRELGAVLSRHTTLKLLLLSACETAVAGSGGMAEQLAESGIPAVLAMRYTVSDDGARQFTTEFYRKLAEGEPLASAMEAAREFLWQEVMAERRRHAEAALPGAPPLAEWFTPVLYLNQHIQSLVKTADYDEKAFRRFYPRLSLRQSEHSRLIGQGFIGRKPYLIRLRKHSLQERAVCLHGMGGLGKTTLAEAFADNFCKRFGGDVLNFRGGASLQPALVLERLFEYWRSKTGADEFNTKEIKAELDSPERDLLEKLDFLLANCLQHFRLLLLFDNFEDLQCDEEGMNQSIAEESAALFYRHLLAKLPRYPQLRILFTTRYAVSDFEGTGLVNIPLKQLTYAEQYRYLNYSDELRRIPPGQREAVYRRLDGHPRAMQFLEKLMQKDSAFSWEEWDGSVGKVEQAVFENLLLETLYRRLPGELQAFFVRTSLFLERNTVSALSAIDEREPGALKTLLQQLSDWSLCFYDAGQEVFEVHALNRAWLLGQNLPEEAERKRLWHQMGIYFKAQATVADVTRAMAYFEQAEAWEDFAESAMALEGHYRLSGLYPLALELSQDLLERNISPYYNARAANAIGLFGLHTGDYDTALRYLEQSLSIQQQIGDRKGEGMTLNNISQIYDAKGDYDTALRYLEQSLSIMQQIGDRKGEGATLNNISQIYKVRGDYDTALRYLEQSLSIQQQIGDRSGEGTTLNNLATTAYAKGDYDTALRYLEQSLSIQQQIGDRKGEGTSLNNISQIYKIRGDYYTALRYLEQSLSISQQIGDRSGEGTTLNNISQIYKVWGDYDTALRYLEQSLSIQQQIGDIAGLAATLHNMGTISFQNDQLEQALVYCFQSYSINTRLGSPNAQHPAQYLEAILEKIGEERFKAIIQQIQPSS